MPNRRVFSSLQPGRFGGLAWNDRRTGRSGEMYDWKQIVGRALNMLAWTG
jgi:hypothetical protein